MYCCGGRDYNLVRAVVGKKIKQVKTVHNRANWRW